MTFQRVEPMFIEQTSSLATVLRNAPAPARPGLSRSWHSRFFSRVGWFGRMDHGLFANWALSAPFYWLWFGFFSLVFLLGLLGALYREDWTITELDIVVTKFSRALGPDSPSPEGRSLGIRVERSSPAETPRPIFPYRLRFLDGRAEGLGTSD
jgi:hypothetical protein